MLTEVQEYLLDNGAISLEKVSIGNLQGVILAIECVINIKPNQNGEPTDGEVVDMVADIVKIARNKGLL